MRGYFFCIVGLTLTTLLFISRLVHAQPPPQAPPPASKLAEPSKPLTAIQWASSFAAALDKAKTEQKPVMVVFTAPWCPACHFFTDMTCKNARVINKAGNFVNVQVDVAKQSAIAKRYGVTGTPSFIWLDSSGRVLNGMEGIGPVSEFLQEMQLALDQFNALPALRWP